MKAWGGFCDGALNVYASDDGAAVFKSRRAARAQYTDVRRIEIHEVPRRGDGGKKPSRPGQPGKSKTRKQKAG
jgi:hypothetical protein